MYKAQKDQVQVFGLRTQYGGGKTTGFALVYDSPEAMKKFEPAYRLVRVGMAAKRERASRQQRTSPPRCPSSESPGRVLTRVADQQASSARTDKRRCAARQRSRAPSPRRRNRQAAAGRCRIQGYEHGAVALGIPGTCGCRHAVGARGLAGESPLKTTWGREGSGPMVFLEYASMKSRCLFFLDSWHAKGTRFCATLFNQLLDSS